MRANSQSADHGVALSGDGFHQSWFPVGLSSEIDDGVIAGKDFLGTRVVMYRDSTGKAVVQGAWCPHLGADLSVGKIVDGQIRCAYHHWRFDSDGTCVHIPTGDKIPPGAKVATYPSAEAWGLVWAFNGEKPLFDVPGIPGTQEAELAFETKLRAIQPIDPWMARSNGVDFQHLRALHGLPVLEPDTFTIHEYGVEYRVERQKAGYLQHGLVTGTNTYSQHLTYNGLDVFMMFTGAPLEHGRSTYFTMVGVRRVGPETPGSEQITQGRLNGAKGFVEKLYVEDAPVLESMRFRKGILVASDRYLSRYLKYVAEFPCAETAA